MHCTHSHHLNFRLLYRSLDLLVDVSLANLSGGKKGGTKTPDAIAPNISRDGGIINSEDKLFIDRVRDCDVLCGRGGESVSQ